MKLDVIKLTNELVSYRSESMLTNVPVTRRVIDVLRQLKFQVEQLPYDDRNGVKKLCVVARLGKGAGGLTMMSHDDVVPAKQEEGWTQDPYKVRPSGGKLFGRGVCDMKGPLAASLCAAARFKASDLKQPVFIVVTADEEIHARGAWEIVRRSKLFKDASSGYGLICEPTRLGVVYAHKGSLSIRATTRGKAAHTSTLKGRNANLDMIPFLVEMKKINELVLSSKRYRNDEFTPPHSEWSIGINDHNVATNIYPVTSTCTVNYRPMPGTDIDGLIERTQVAAKKHRVKIEITRPGDPVYTDPTSAIVRTSLKLSGSRKARTVPYGTDGLAFRTKMDNLVVLGPGDIAQAHTVDEWVEVEQLHKGVQLYERFIDHVCVQAND
ncbi:MAG TPA: M20/M25/M40 family metallo-hydrolase [Candidatus Latescibacteria bacterium]|jgi:acetylornithine deacetylase|nr:M20/M25/M40 family metallo-hydrolase [Candidatus Latescibacterota bacterium]HJP30911.1 M20/M25/M40 family metallo-hydrolase [Candidatus Latescibacterota bacterium]